MAKYRNLYQISKEDDDLTVTTASEYDPAEELEAQQEVEAIAQETEDLAEVTSDTTEVAENLAEDVQQDEEKLEEPSSVTEEDVVQANESLVYNLAKLGYPYEQIKRMKVSSEAASTPAERLRLSVEEKKGILATIWQKIKEIFKYIWDKLKAAWRAILKFFGIQEKKVEDLKKDANESATVIKNNPQAKEESQKAKNDAENKINDAGNGELLVLNVNKSDAKLLVYTKPISTILRNYILIYKDLPLVDGKFNGEYILNHFDNYFNNIVRAMIWLNDVLHHINNILTVDVTKLDPNSSITTPYQLLEHILHKVGSATHLGTTDKNLISSLQAYMKDELAGTPNNVWNNPIGIYLSTGQIKVLSWKRDKTKSSGTGLEIVNLDVSKLMDYNKTEYEKIVEQYNQSFIKMLDNNNESAVFDALARDKTYKKLISDTKTSYNKISSSLTDMESLYDKNIKNPPRYTIASKDIIAVTNAMKVIINIANNVFAAYEKTSFDYVKLYIEIFKLWTSKK